MKRLVIGTFVAATLSLLAVPLIAQNPLRQQGGGAPPTFLAEQPPHPVQLLDYSQPQTPAHETPAPQATPRQEHAAAPTPVHDVVARVTSAPSDRHVVESQSFTVISTTYKVPNPNVKTALVTFLKEHVGKPELFEITADDHDRITVIASPKAQKTIGDMIGLMKQSPRRDPSESASPYESSGYSGHLPSQSSR